MFHLVYVSGVLNRFNQPMEVIGYQMARSNKDEKELESLDMSVTRYEAESADLLFPRIFRFHALCRLSGYRTLAVSLQSVFYVRLFSGIARKTVLLGI